MICICMYCMYNDMDSKCRSLVRHRKQKAQKQSKTLKSKHMNYTEVLYRKLRQTKRNKRYDGITTTVQIPVEKKKLRHSVSHSLARIRRHKLKSIDPWLISMTMKAMPSGVGFQVCVHTQVIGLYSTLSRLSEKTLGCLA